MIQVIADIDAPEPAEEKINAYLAAHAGEVDGIITTAWVPAVVASNALRRIGDKRIKMVGIDHDEVVLGAIRDGFVHGTMLQNPYGQGYIGSYAADRLRSGCTVKADAPFESIALTNKFIDSGTVFAGADAVDNYVGVHAGDHEGPLRRTSRPPTSTATERRSAAPAWRRRLFHRAGFGFQSKMSDTDHDPALTAPGRAPGAPRPDGAAQAVPASATSSG